MQRILTLTLVMITFVVIASAQSDTLLYERFETGGSSFQLNTTDLGGALGTAGVNQWIVNNAYAGGNGQITCLGFPFTFTIPATQSQPPLITGGANTSYMHIMSDPGQASGIINSNYAASDGICTLDETNFAKMSSDVITTAYDTVTVSFLWHCSGGTNIYGELYYSINQGATWNLVSTPIAQYKNQSGWMMQNIASATFAGHSSLRFGFRFVNQNSTSAADPGFGIDEFLITGKVASPPPVAAFAVSDSTICAGDCVTFADSSTGNPNNWFWVFQGASTGFSTAQNPGPVCYSNPGTYNVTLIVGNASGTDTLTVTTVTVFPAPATPLISFSGDTLFATPGFASYQWLFNDTIIPGATDSGYVTVTNGAYSVVVTDTNGCSAESDTINFSTAVFSPDAVAEFVIYPNPVSDQLQISSIQPISNILIYDMQGRSVMNLELTASTEANVSLTNLVPGVYMIEVTTTEGTGRARVMIK